MNASKMRSQAVVAGTTLIVTSMAMLGGSWWSYAAAVGEMVKEGVEVAIPDEIHINASKHELEKARAEAARAFESVKQLEDDQVQLDEQRAKVRREKAIYGEKLQAVKMLIDQARAKPDGTIDVAKVSEEAERLLQAHDQRARLEVKLNEQAATIEQLKQDLLATAKQTLDDVERLRIQIEVTKSESHAHHAKQAIAQAEQIITRLKARRDAAGNVERLLNELSSLGNAPTDEVTISELLSRIDSHLAR